MPLEKVRPANRTNPRKFSRPADLSILLFLIFGATLLAQDLPTPQSVPEAPNLLRLEGVDPETHVHYIRLLLSQPTSTDSAKTPPRLTFECLEKDGKPDFKWYVSFGGITDYRFLPPFHPTPGVPYHLSETDVDLKMSFVEGSSQWKPYVRSWTLLSTGELRYRNPGWHSPNLESLSLFMSILKSYHGLQISYAKPAKGDPEAVLFHTEPLLRELKKNAICEQ